MVAIPSEKSGFDFAKYVLLTIVAMLAFAANSLLCRLALGQQLIDAASFTSVRMVSGAMMLGLLMLPRWRAKDRAKVDWRSAAMLFTYMAFFSFAYLSLSAGTGALILFGAVQLTMFTAALRGGEQFPLLSWAGLALAVGGLVFLVSPGITAPDPIGAILMVIAGVAWGFYSLLGRQVADALEATANNFICSVPFAVMVSLLFMNRIHSSPGGLALAAVSGAITSGLGYVVWYSALRGLTATRAATVQLSVPVFAAFGGVLLLSEPITPRLAVASVVTLGGVWIVLAQRAARPANST
jgi:drug/metabolite transporter (DMT)-like permease